MHYICCVVTCRAHNTHVIHRIHTTGFSAPGQRVGPGILPIGTHKAHFPEPVQNQILVDLIALKYNVLRN